ALTGFRYVALWVVVAVPLLARSSLEVTWLREQARRLKLAGEGAGLFRPPAGPAPWVWSGLFAAALRGGGRGGGGDCAPHKPEITPAAALDRLLDLHGEWRRAHGRRPVVFHCYHWGGYLTWHGGPDFRNWIDDRNEVQGQEHIQDYFSIVETDPGWERKL